MFLIVFFWLNVPNHAIGYSVNVRFLLFTHLVNLFLSTAHVFQQQLIKQQHEYLDGISTFQFFSQMSLCFFFHIFFLKPAPAIRHWVTPSHLLRIRDLYLAIEGGESFPSIQMLGEEYNPPNDASWNCQISG